jgi:thiol-disulfide isomerase/thioredoxin/outer membrane lipoprotein-sorting protein
MTKATLRVCSAAALLSLAAGASAQVDEAAKAKLQAAHDALKEATSYSYHCQMKGTGGMMSMLPEITSEVVMVRDPQTREWVGKIYGTRAEVAGMPALNFAIYTKGNLRIWIDDDAKQVIERPAEQAMNEQVQSASSGSVRELMLPEPLATALTSTTITAEPPVSLDGVQCDVIYTDPGENQTKFRWTLGPDHMPRRVDQIIKGGGLDMSQAWILSNVKINTPIPMDDVKVRIPQGYTHLPAFTPPPPAPANPALPSTTVPSEPVRQVGTSLNDLAPDFQLNDAEGKPVTLAGLKGSIVLLDFWGTWCIPCQKAAPKIEELHQKYKDRGVKVYGLAVREGNDQNPINYMKEHNLTYGLLLKADSVARLFRVRLFPTYILIGRDGSIAHISTKNKEEELVADLTEAIDKVLASGPPANAEPKPAPKGEPAGAGAGAGSPAGDKPPSASPRPGPGKP